jgi:hypothetical protein
MIAKAIAQVDRTVMSFAMVGPTLLLDKISSPDTLYVLKAETNAVSTFAPASASLLSIM